MKLATTTAILGHRRDGGYTSYIESMQRCRAAGFKYLDISFCEAINGGSDIAGDDWEERIYMLGEQATRSGVEFVQSHPVFLAVNIDDKPEELQQLFHRMMSRSLAASAILGVKWAVFHPGSVQKDGEADIEASVKANMVNFNFAVELAAKLNVGVAYENMPSTPGWPGRFSSKAEDLIGLVDAYSDENIGICWDFGHGNMIYEDQTAVLKKIGKRLKATHVADNYKRSDDHMMTFHGSTDWESIMPALKEIGYEGAFAFEAGMETKNMPEQLKDDLVRLEYKTGKYCLGLAK